MLRACYAMTYYAMPCELNCTCLENIYCVCSRTVGWHVDYQKVSGRPMIDIGGWHIAAVNTDNANLGN